MMSNIDVKFGWILSNVNVNLCNHFDITLISFSNVNVNVESLQSLCNHIDILHINCINCPVLLAGVKKQAKDPNASAEISVVTLALQFCLFLFVFYVFSLSLKRNKHFQHFSSVLCFFSVFQFFVLGRGNNQTMNMKEAKDPNAFVEISTATLELQKYYNLECFWLVTISISAEM